MKHITLRLSTLSLLMLLVPDFFSQNYTWSETGSFEGVLKSYGVNTGINSVTTDSNGDLYAAGNFTNFFNRFYVAKWNGSTWKEVKSATSSLDANWPIKVIKTDKFNNLYTAGSFFDLTSGGHYVAKWNGSTWSKLGVGPNGLNNEINDITIDKNGNIYAAGRFTNSNNKYYVAKWNGSSFIELGTGINSLNASGEIASIACDTVGNIYACGSFKNTLNNYYVAKWNGTTWVELKNGTNILNSSLPISKVIVDKNGNLYAGGDFNIGLNCNLAKWNGTNWISIDGNNPFYSNSRIFNVYIDHISNTIYASGQYTNVYVTSYVAKWSGTSWVNLGAQGTPTLNLIANVNSITSDASGKIYVGGIYKGSYFDTCYVASWNGNQWAAVETPNTALNAHAPIYSTITDQQGNVYASGSFKNPLGYRYVAKWDGIKWVELGTGNNSLKANDDILALAKDNLGNIYAVGGFTDSLGKKYVAKWNGSAWSKLGNNLDSLMGYNSNYLNSMCVDNNNNVYVAGSFQNYPNTTYIAKWNGTRWEYLGGLNYPWGSNITGLFEHIACDQANNIYATGMFDQNSNQFLVTKWDGNNWSILPTPTGSININSNIYAITCDNNNNVYIGGNFAHVTVRYVAKWDGTTWTELNSNNGWLNANQTISLLASDMNNNIYATGYYYNTTSLYISKWNGNSWSELASPTNSLNANHYIETICFDDSGNVYAAGQFYNEYGFSYVAKFGQSSMTNNLSDSHVKSQEIKIYPNPSNGIFYLELNNESQITITDILGREIKNEKYAQGKHMIDLSQTISGIYFITAHSNNQAVTSKIIIKQ